MKTPFENDLTISLNVNGGAMPKAIWNLIVSIRDCKLYSKGIKPHRHWRISDVKRYFGVSGNAEALADKLQAMLDDFKTNNR
jgi:hypothetical protein